MWPPSPRARHVCVCPKRLHEVSASLSRRFASTGRNRVNLGKVNSREQSCADGAAQRRGLRGALPASSRARASASRSCSVALRRRAVGVDREPYAFPYAPSLQRPGLRLQDRPCPWAGQSNSARAHGSYRPDPRLSVQIRDVDRKPHPEGVHRARGRQQHRALDSVPSQQPASACPSRLGELQRNRLRGLRGGERGHGCEGSGGVKRAFATGSLLGGVPGSETLRWPSRTRMALKEAGGVHHEGETRHIPVDLPGSRVFSWESAVFQP